jgi:hypothetical protein
VRALTNRWLNERLKPREQAEARFLAEEISGRPYVELYPQSRGWLAAVGATA